MKEVEIAIEGMKCPMCEKHTVEALMKVPGVKKTTASHVEKKAILEVEGEVDAAALEKAVSEAGYEPKGVTVKDAPKKGFFARLFRK